MMVIHARCGGGRDCRLAFEDNNAVGEICGHDEIVLDDKSSLLCVQDESVKGSKIRNGYCGG
jgi:hypothetical protein